MCDRDTDCIMIYRFCSAYLQESLQTSNPAISGVNDFESLHIPGSVIAVFPGFGFSFSQIRINNFYMDAVGGFLDLELFVFKGLVFQYQ